MNSVLLAISKEAVVAIVIPGILFVAFMMVIMVAKRWIKVGPNQVLIISGRRRSRKGLGPVGFRIVKGGGAFVLPIIEKYDLLSLELMTIDVKTPEVYTVTGVPIIVDGVAQIKVKGDDVSISTASEQFLSMERVRIAEVAHQTLEGHLRAILGMMTVEEIYKNRDAFAQRVQEVATSDMANMGLTIVSFTLRDIRDNQGYLDALGKPRTAQVKRDAIIAQAEADRDSVIKSAEANRDGQQAKFGADTEIAFSQRDYEMKRAEYQASVNLKKAESDLAYDLQQNKTMQLVKAEEVRVLAVEKERLIDVQAKEILRKEKELEATINRPADAEKYRIETLAAAERFRMETEAKGQAEAKRQLGEGEASANKARGLAEADVILAQGESTAEAMEKKAAAWRGYNEAAIMQIFLEHAPELAAAIAQPLSKTEKIVIINSDGDGAGASKITGDVANIMAQLPEVVQSLTGMDINAALQRISKLGSGQAGGENKPDQPAGESKN
ncbi:MAG: flotillin family protein [Anaerolineaceae bacterium]|nr:flotillin family protein [Anaerolineaceae bacterium]